LIGRLLHDGAGVFEDQLAALKKDTTRFGTTGEDIDYALLMDGLQAEREQGITIDVAYRYFSTRSASSSSPTRPVTSSTRATWRRVRRRPTSRSFCRRAQGRLAADAPSRVHLFAARHPHVIVAINKMDLVGYSEEAFDAIRRECGEFLAKLSTADVAFVPICARKARTSCTGSANMPWYRGGPLLDRLESVFVSSDQNLVDLRLPVQLVLRPNQDYRGFAGTIASGVLRVGDEVAVLPSGRKAA
jgi:sulfate adenylyltransferase subunit 1 (EFTu-like GTPase family)